MYATLLQVAHDIIVIWWALMIVLGVILLIVLIVIAARINGVISKATHLVTMISQYIILPFSYIAGMFSRSSEQKEVRKRRKTGDGEK